MGSIYLIRHGQASFGAEDYDVLSPLGVRQSQVLGEHLSRLGLHFDRCLSGDLRRQQDTAQATLAQLKAPPELEVDNAFNEFDADAVIRTLLPELLTQEPNALEVMRNGPQHRAEFQRLFDLLIKRWVAGTHQHAQLESWDAFVQRVQAGLQRVLEQAEHHQRIAVFTSGGTITALLRLITGVPASKAFDMNWQIVNTSLSQLKFRGNEVTLASFNSHAHLQLLGAPELITYR